MRSPFIFCLLLLLPFASHCQNAADPPTPSDPTKQQATVAGTVLRLDTGEPLKNARVELDNRSDDKLSIYETTDDLGQFHFESVQPGSYWLAVSRNGYLHTTFGQKRPGGAGAVLTLLPGQRMTDLVFKLARTGAITGRVFDEDGEPISGAQIHVLQPFRGNGILYDVANSNGPRSTNDLGEYRAFDLYPGRYYVSVTPRSESPFARPAPSQRQKARGGYLPGYYPNTSDPSKAQTILVHAGDEVRSVDFFLRPAPVVAIRGKVFIALPAPSVCPANVYVYPRATGLGQAVAGFSADVNHKDGSFEIRNVPPGSYFIRANCRDEDSGVWLFNRREIEVSNYDVEGLVLTISPGVEVQGRVSWEGTSPPRQFRRASVGLESVDKDAPPPSSQPVKPDGTFLFKNVPEGFFRPYVQFVDSDAIGFLKSARYGNSPVTDAGFPVHAGSDATLELTVSSRSAQVSGMVLNSDSLPAVGADVVLVLDDHSHYVNPRYWSVATDQYGKFTITGVAPGDFKLFSCDPVDEGDWSDEQWRKPYESKGLSVHLEENDRKSVELTLIEPVKDSAATP